ncbi:hypothetical protein QBC47DRAFT_384893 [Echria macrotheca]|uniref:magnesium chelatase n=1 Tax=Echria macrotheca TaxID=438768 RepID=A0AAJ0F5Q0_9PEZI|nr:hypothetical protein QBC47DRAFT_384893 [Echria macrotheca]
MAAAADPDDGLLDKARRLNDLELAALLSLIAREHCLISTAPEAVDELTEELRLIAARTFGLSSAVVSCHAHTTLDDFATALLLTSPPRTSSPVLTSGRRSTSPFQARHPPPHYHDAGSTSGSYFPRTAGGPIASPASSSTAAASQGSQPLIANVVLAKNLDRAPRAVQIQALELLRTRRIFTRTNVQTAPKQFLFVAVVGAPSGGRAHVAPHLNDFFYLAHWHDPQDGFDYLDEDYGIGEDDDDDDDYDEEDDDIASTNSSSTSVVKRKGSSSFMAPRPSASSAQRDMLLLSSITVQQRRPLLSETEISRLAQLSRRVSVATDVARYMTNIVAFLRTHRAAAGGGASPAATKHFETLARSLAALHGLDFVTPSLVALAAKKVYLHRVTIVRPERERSMQWGSDLEAVEAVLDGLGAEDVIEDVLGMVAVPT